ncbi:MAG: double-strand break repair protein AddB [Neomegalonema sp.]|nr:double-strand break repair protein AddB [Neomegalonema sp.]
MDLFHEPGPRVFTIAPGMPFAQTLAQGIKARMAASGADPLALADVEIIVSTQRAVRALRSAFLRVNDGAVLGPRLRALGDIANDPAVSGQVPPAIGSMRRLLILARLVRVLLEQAPELGAPGTAAPLASDLAALLDSAQAAGVTLDALERITTDNHAAHWAHSKRFLDIIRQLWPQILAAEGRCDPEERRRRVVGLWEQLWQGAPPSHPVIVAGSTGSLDTSAWFIELVSRLPQGAVVLPGLDTMTDPAAQAQLTTERAPEHPQTGLFNLIRRIGVPLEDVRGWEHDRRPHAGPRLHLLSQALRPAPVTDAWQAQRGALAQVAPSATAALSLIEAPGPREEAAAIAIALREALTTKGKRAALITPDRTLARRVTAELTRWGIEPDDSGGRPLSLTAPGVYFTLVAEAALTDFAPGPFLSVLKHPIAAAGFERGAHLRLSRLFERKVLRDQRPAPGLAAQRIAVAQAGTLSEAEADQTLDTEAVIDAPDAPDLVAWFDAVAAIFAPLADLCALESVPLADLLAAHAEAAEALSRRADPDLPPELFERAAGEQLADFLHRFSAEAAQFGEIAPREYPALLGQVMAGEAVREAFGRHPRLAILGPLEARMQSADLVVLAGLNEGVWPQIPEPDAWISRDMRSSLGLPPLESRIGLSAHDFFQAAMAPEAILSRARKKDGAPTVPSRWLLRITNLLQGVAPSDLAAMRARGERFVALVPKLEPHVRLTPAPRPAPKPPIAARPRAFSVTEVETLIRDPYAIYAKKVLRLRPLPELVERPDARERGTLLHKIVEGFVGASMGALPRDPEALFEQAAREALVPVEPWPSIHAFWLARAHQIKPWFLATEMDRRALGNPLALEARGVTQFDTLLGTITLRAEADRIDKRHGGYAIFDYKTGSIPSKKQQAEFAKQLPLEAAILRASGFEGVQKGEVVKLAYLHLKGGEEGGKEVDFAGDDLGPAGEAEEALAGLAKLMAAYANPDQGYPSRLRPETISFSGDYDHLARLGEWVDGAWMTEGEP